MLSSNTKLGFLVAASLLVITAPTSAALRLRRSAKVAPMPTLQTDSFSALNPMYGKKGLTPPATRSTHSKQESLESVSIASTHSRSSSVESTPAPLARSRSNSLTKEEPVTPPESPARARRVEFIQNGGTLRTKRYLANFQSHWNNPAKRYRISLKELDTDLHALIAPCYSKDVSAEEKQQLFAKIMQYLKARIDELESYSAQATEQTQQADCSTLSSILHRLTSHLVFSTRFLGWQLCTGRHESFLKAWNSPLFTSLSREEAEKAINDKVSDISLNFEGGEFSFAKRSSYTTTGTNIKSFGRQSKP